MRTPVPARAAPKAAGLVLALLCILACDFPQDPGDEKGSLTITLPGAKPPARNLARARAVHLPEEISGDMSYTLDFYQPGGNFSVGPTRERMITVELEPGYWDIVVTAQYGSALAAREKKPQVEIRAGRKNSVSFTMNADEFITPDRVGWSSQNQSIGVGDPPPSLTLTMNTSTPFSSIPGWNDNFLLGWYYEDSNGSRTVVTAPDNFSGPGTASFSCMVDNTTVGTF
ncbi:MAG: hypothetical protein LBH26_00645, partial [Treponema sp.]|nr:hypothetical protein [Treponema sp.]